MRKSFPFLSSIFLVFAFGQLRPQEKKPGCCMHQHSEDLRKNLLFLWLDQKNYRLVEKFLDKDSSQYHDHQGISLCERIELIKDSSPEIISIKNILASFDTSSPVFRTRSASFLAK